MVQLTQIAEFDPKERELFRMARHWPSRPAGNVCAYRDRLQSRILGLPQFFRRNAASNYRPRLFFLIVLIGFLSVQLAVYSKQQPQIAIGHGRGDDGITYGKVADSFLANEQPVGDAPFVYRIGVPWLASIVSRLIDLTVDESFRAIDVLSLYILVVLIYRLALQFCQPAFAFLACLLYLLPYYGDVRLAYFYPVLVDTPWTVLIVLSLIIMAHDVLSPLHVLSLAMITFAATLMRETGILIPLTFLLSIYPIRRVVSLEAFLGYKVEPIRTGLLRSNFRLISFSLVLLLAAALAVFLSREATIATGKYSFLNAALDSARANDPLHLAMPVFLAFGGPMLSLLIVRPKIVLNHFRDTPAHLTFVVLTILVSYFGGVNTVRFLSWASPIVLLLICRCLQAVQSELPSSNGSLRKAVVALTLLGMISFQIISLHPFDGYFYDYTAWYEWGGLQTWPVKSVYLIRFADVTISSIFLLRWFGSAPTTKINLRSSE